jgi:predicted deacylase
MQMAFPGDPEGSITQRVVHFLHENCIRQCSAVINFHAKAQIDWSVVMTHDNRDVRRRSMALAEAYGTPIFEMSHKRFPNFLVVSAMNLGIPAFLSEPVWPPIGGSGPGTSIRGLLNVMKHLGMLEGSIEPQNENLVPPGRYIRTHFYADSPGLIRPLKGPGERVIRGELIGLIYDVLGNRVSEIRSPGDGYLRVWASRRVVARRGHAGEIFQMP